MKRWNRDRRHLAHIAARLMIEEGLKDYARATRKAACRLGITDPLFFPEREEIDAAILEHCRLYRSEIHSAFIARLEKIALELMEALHRFSPKLGGALVTETALDHSPLEIFLFSEDPDEVVHHLAGISVEFWPGPTRKIPVGKRKLDVPTLNLLWQGQETILYLFPERMGAQLPKEQFPLLTLKALRRRITEKAAGSGSDAGTCRPDRQCPRSSASQ